MPSLSHYMIPLLAQQADVIVRPAQQQLTVMTSVLLLVLAGGLIFLGFVYMIIRHARQERELEHIENVRAIEMGRPIPGKELPGGEPVPFWTIRMMAVGLGLALPVIVMGMAYNTMNQQGISPELAKTAWIAAGLIGVAGVISATILILKGETTAPGTALARDIKPTINDPDAYDTTSRRGWNEPVDHLRTPSHSA